MMYRLLMVVLPLVLLDIPLFAEVVPSLCSQCLASAKEERDKCLEAAISREDKITCEEKHEARTKGCDDGECKIERAAQSGNRDPSQPRHPVTP